MAVEDRPGGGSLGLEHRPVGDFAVPFDQRRHRAAAADHAVVERPDRVRDRPVVAVDQEQIALIVRLRLVTGQMDLAHVLEREVREVVPSAAKP